MLGDSGKVGGERNRDTWSRRMHQDHVVDVELIIVVITSGSINKNNTLQQKPSRAPNSGQQQQQQTVVVVCNRCQHNNNDHTILQQALRLSVACLSPRRVLM